MTRMLSAKFMAFFMVGLCMWPAQNHAQVKKDDLIEEIKAAYEALDYEETEIKAQAALQNFAGFSSEQLTEIHKILALVYFSENQPELARGQFLLALSLNPGLELDSLLVSPKILDFFESVKEKRLQEGSLPDKNNEVRYILMEDPRPHAALRSMILPGWGQLYKKQKKKGILLAGLWSAGVVASLSAHLARQSARNNYLAEINPDRIESRYQTFNRYHRLRNAFLLVTGGIWLYSYLDAFLSRVSLPGMQVGINIEPLLMPEAPLVHLSLRFDFPVK